MKSILNKKNWNLGRFWDWFGGIWVASPISRNPFQDINFGSWNGFLEIGEAFTWLLGWLCCVGLR
jgi:hypothetical protein